MVENVHLQLGFETAVMVKLASPLKMLMHRPAGRLERSSTEQPVAWLQFAHVDVLNDRVSTAALVVARASPERMIDAAEKRMLKKMQELAGVEI
jgi:hypothetical protein